MDAAATINFKSGEARRLFEGGYHSRAAFIMYIPVNCRNSGRGQTKRARAAVDRSDEAMASQVEEMFCLDSIVRGHHVYKTVWTSWLGEILLFQNLRTTTTGMLCV